MMRINGITVVPDNLLVIPDNLLVIPDNLLVIPDSIRDPVPFAPWIAGQARNDDAQSSQ